MARKQIKVGGKFTTKERNALPASAFALPKERKYPLKKKKGGKLMPSRSHASNAKARAEQQYEKGNLTASQKKTIDRKANKILKKGKKRLSMKDAVKRYTDSLKKVTSKRR